MANDETQSMLARLYVERGLQKIDVEPHAGLPWLMQALKTEPEDSSAKEMHRLRIGLMLAEVPKLLQFWPSASDVKFNEQGSMVAVAQGDHVILYDLQKERTIESLRHEQPVVRIAFNHAGDRLATVAQVDDGNRRYSRPWEAPPGPPMCRIWNTLTGKPITASTNIKDDQYRVYNTPKVHFSADDLKLVAIGADITNRSHDIMSARVYDSGTLQPVSDRFAHHCALDYTDGYHVISPDGLRIAVPHGASADDPETDWGSENFRGERQPQQWDLMTGRQVHPPLGHAGAAYSQPIYNVDGSQLATVDKQEVKIWDANTGTLIREISFSDSKLSSHRVSFHPDGKQVFVIEKNNAKLIEIESGKVIRTWSHEDKFTVGAKAEQFIYKENSETHLFNTAASGESHLSLPNVYGTFFSADGSRLMIQPAPYEPGGSLYWPPTYVMQTSDGKRLTPPWRFTGKGIAAPLSNSGRYLLSRQDNGFWLWDLDARPNWIHELAEEQPLATVTKDPLMPPAQPVGEFAKPIASTDDGGHSLVKVEGGFRLFDTRSWQPMGSLITSSEKLVKPIALSDDKRLLATGSGDIWDLESGQRRFTTEASKWPIEQVFFVPGGKSFGTVSHQPGGFYQRRSEIRMCSTVDGTPLAPPMTDNRFGRPRCAVHPSGKILAAASSGLKLWDIEHGLELSEGIELRQYKWLNDQRVFFSPGGEKLCMQADDRFFVMPWAEIVASIPSDDRVLEAWTGILSGQCVDRAGGLSSLTSEELNELWKTVETSTH